MARTRLKHSNLTAYIAASAIGIIAGMRSMMAPAVVASIARADSTSEHPKSFGLLGHAVAPNALKVMAGMELIADKLPFVPNRTDVGPLVGRMLIGAFCGATLCSALDKSKLGGAFVGGLGAAGSTFAGYEIRKRVGRAFFIPDVAVALAEDATAVWIGDAIGHTFSTDVVTKS